jgi:hypothetical protein
MIQNGSEQLLELIAMLYTDILRGSLEPTEVWKETFVKVLYKKGDAKLPDNYRPISMLSILYKLFSRIICSRIKVTLEAAQSRDQAGFRAGYSCDDHLFTITALTDVMNEYDRPLWVCAVDFKKAFDSVEHAAIWKSLLGQGVNANYVSILAKMYERQRGRVVAQAESKPFDINRGTKQGDPMSPILFNAVLEEVIRPLKEVWIQKRWGIKVDGDFLNNLRFADDILLIARSRRQIKTMLAELVKSAGRVGLEIHMGKPKILSNSKAVYRNSFEMINGQKV